MRWGAILLALLLAGCADSGDQTPATEPSPTVPGGEPSPTEPQAEATNQTKTATSDSRNDTVNVFWANISYDGASQVYITPDPPGEDVSTAMGLPLAARNVLVEARCENATATAGEPTPGLQIYARYDREDGGSVSHSYGTGSCDVPALFDEENFEGLGTLNSLELGVDYFVAVDASVDVTWAVSVFTGDIPDDYTAFGDSTP